MKVLDSATVKRYHTMDTIGTQDIASHSWGVAVILIRITGGKCSVGLLMAALMHDVPEAVTGDSPATAKWRSKALKLALNSLEGDVEKELGIDTCLPEDEDVLLKVADMLELIHYSVRQVRLGNRTFSDVFHRGREFLLSNSDFLNEEARTILNDPEKEYYNVIR